VQVLVTGSGGAMVAGYPGNKKAGAEEYCRSLAGLNFNGGFFGVHVFFVMPIAKR
jgi:hypothetical protein